MKNNKRYVILTDSRKQPGMRVVLVDRQRFPNQWWSDDIAKAVVFSTIESANIQAAKIKFNSPTVYTFNIASILLKPVNQRLSSFQILLNRKESEWHDDDWHEGMND